MKRISLVINVDTREGWEANETTQTKMFDGTRSYDFIVDGVENKIKAFTIDGCEVETTLFVDVHKPLPNDLIQLLNGWVSSGKLSNLVLNKHKEYFENQDYFGKYNDVSFLNALIMARGEYLVHFDGDMNIFTKDSSSINEWIALIDSGKYDYVSYPSPYSPAPVDDPAFLDYWWASTRFFICKRKILDPTEILKCLQSSDYLYGKYGDQKRRCSWLEHILGIMAGKDRVFYPPLDINRNLVFSWSKYTKGTLKKLNDSSYLSVANFVMQSGGIQFPCDVRG